MNKMRRRYAKARRRKARLIREMQEWTKTNYTEAPKRGRLRRPALILMRNTYAVLEGGFAQINELLAPIFGRRSSHDRGKP